MVSSMRWRATSPPSCSTLNQVTVRLALMAAWPSASQKWLLPVPEGPATTRFSWRPTHSSDGEGALGGGGDREPGRVEGVEGLAGGERGAASADLDRGGVAAAGFFVEQHPDDFGGVPALRFGGGDDVVDLAAHVGHAQPPAEPIDLASSGAGEWSSGAHDCIAGSPSVRRCGEVRCGARRRCRAATSAVLRGLGASIGVGGGEDRQQVG